MKKYTMQENKILKQKMSKLHQNSNKSIEKKRCFERLNLCPTIIIPEARRLTLSST